MISGPFKIPTTNLTHLLEIQLCTDETSPLAVLLAILTVRGCFFRLGFVSIFVYGVFADVVDFGGLFSPFFVILLLLYLCSV
ncbi:hypothetical protein RHGRI_023511 [Rhododendron griersonianum]|nr:hypothetical protein RHGRI_023511 [Rhododendron griersonianum]